VAIASLGAAMGCETYWSPEPTDAADTAELALPAWVTQPGGATEPYLGPIAFEVLQLSCDDAADRWSWEVLILGWSHRATIDWFLAGPRHHETHTLPSVESGPWGYWDRLARTVDATQDGSWKPDLTTAMTCRNRDETTQVVRVYDAADVLAACAIWGPDVEQVTSMSTTWNSPIVRPEELVDCEDWR
jgi:hypothetical protein